MAPRLKENAKNKIGFYSTWPSFWNFRVRPIQQPYKKRTTAAETATTAKKQQQPQQENKNSINIEKKHKHQQLSIVVEQNSRHKEIIQTDKTKPVN